MLTILDPVGPLHILRFPLAKRLTSLQGKRVGTLDNAKHNAGIMLGSVAEWLERNHGTVTTARISKPKPTVPAKAEDYDRIVAETDLAIVGPGD